MVEDKQEVQIFSIKGTWYITLELGSECAIEGRNLVMSERAFTQIMAYLLERLEKGKGSKAWTGVPRRLCGVAVCDSRECQWHGHNYAIHLPPQVSRLGDGVRLSLRVFLDRVAGLLAKIPHWHLEYLSSNEQTEFVRRFVQLVVVPCLDNQQVGQGRPP